MKTIVKTYLIILPLVLMSCGEPDLAGTWTDPNSCGDTYEFKDDGTAVVTIKRALNDADCSRLVGTTQFSFKYTVGEGQSGYSGYGEVKAMDLSLTKVTEIYTTEDSVASANDQAVCGITDWSLSSARLITDIAACNFDKSTVKAGSQYHAVFSITGGKLNCFPGSEFQDPSHSLVGFPMENDDRKPSACSRLQRL